MSDSYSARPLPRHPRLKACLGGLCGRTGVVGRGGEDLNHLQCKVTSADESGSHVIVVLIVVFLVLCGRFFSAGSGELAILATQWHA